MEMPKMSMFRITIILCLAFAVVLAILALLIIKWTLPDAIPEQTLGLLVGGLIGIGTIVATGAVTVCTTILMSEQAKNTREEDQKANQEYFSNILETIQVIAGKSNEKPV